MGHPSPYLHVKPWPDSMKCLKKSVVVVQKKQGKGKEYRITRKKMIHRIMETGLSVGVIDAVFFKGGDLFIAYNKCEYEQIMSKNVPIVVEELWKKLSLGGGLSEVENILEKHIFKPTKHLFSMDDESYSAKRFPSIKQLLENQGYTIEDVLGDGNCGIYAILQAHKLIERLNIDLNLDSANGGNKEDMPQWKAAKQFREFVFEASDPMRKMVTELGNQQQNRQLASDDLGRIAEKIGYDILLVVDSYTSAQFFSKNGTQKVVENLSEINFKDTICIYYKNNHFQAFVRRQDENSTMSIL